MDQKQWEQRLDRAADKVSQMVGEGVHVLEDAFAKGRNTLKEEVEGRPASSTGPSSTAPGAGAGATGPGAAPPTAKGSPRLGLMLVALGIVWLLHSLGILDQPVFPILLIILGVYFIVRSK
jgi:hypothetical protein